MPAFFFCVFVCTLPLTCSDSTSHLKKSVFSCPYCLLRASFKVLPAASLTSRRETRAESRGNKSPVCFSWIQFWTRPVQSQGRSWRCDKQGVWTARKQTHKHVTVQRVWVSLSLSFHFVLFQSIRTAAPPLDRFTFSGQKEYCRTNELGLTHTNENSSLSPLTLMWLNPLVLPEVQL